MNENILLVEDDFSVSQMIKFALENEGYSCFEVDNLEYAENIIATEEVSLILLDWMLPGLSGIELARRIRRETKNVGIPIIMLTAKSEEADKLKGFSVGIDDYLTKPFSVKELLARMTAIFRRTRDRRPRQSQEPLKINLESKRVFSGDDEVKLTTKEFLLLSFLHSRKERVFSRYELIDHVWDSREDIDERTVDVHIRRLRKVLEPFGCHVYIQTVRGFGYRFSTKFP